jgi:hypothetical protein
MCWKSQGAQTLQGILEATGRSYSNMTNDYPETGDRNLQNLRDTLTRIEREPDPYFSSSARAELKKILIHRIAVLERIAILEADAVSKPSSRSGLRV